MSDSVMQCDDLHDFEPIDGIHELRQRSESRLWYRLIQPDNVPLIPVARPAQRTYAVVTAPVVPIADQLAEIARIAIAAGMRAEAQTEQPKPPDEASGAADWVIVPENCPALLLSASPTLGGQVTDAHLAPGVRFRVASIANGVAEIEVLHGGGAIVRGYCNTVDLACADPNRLSARPITGRLRNPITSKFKIGNLAQTFGGFR